MRASSAYPRHVGVPWYRAGASDGATKSPRPTGTRVTRGTTLVDAASRRIHSWRGLVRHPVLGYFAELILGSGEHGFASATQGRVLASCRTGLAPPPGSLSDAAAVLLPVIVFDIEL